MPIDLHTHSTASDGTDSPADLIQRAAAAGLDVVAITDHDTTAGWQPALAARPEHLTVVRGAEFSCAYFAPDGSKTNIHLLGYLFDPDDPKLRTERERLRESRRSRGERITANLVAAGYPISWPRVQELAAGGAVGRPHLGRALVEAGVVPDVGAAFAELLADGSPYYVPKADMDVFTAMHLLRGAGGLAVFAHPLARGRGPVVADEVIAALAEAGLVGIEVDHPDHTEADRAHAARLAADLELVGLGSSDYHGTNKRTPLAACTTTSAAYALLVDRPTAIRPVGPR